MSLRRIVAVTASAAETGGVYSLTEHTLPPDFGPRLHIHHNTDEADYILGGELTFQVGDERVVASRGDVHTHPARDAPYACQHRRRARADTHALFPARSGAILE